MSPSAVPSSVYPPLLNLGWYEVCGAPYLQEFYQRYQPPSADPNTPCSLELLWFIRWCTLLYRPCSVYLHYLEVQTCTVNSWKSSCETFRKVIGTDYQLADFCLSERRNVKTLLDHRVRDNPRMHCIVCLMQMQTVITSLWFQHD